ncbi:MAG: M56 family metallopeptidase, partial [Thermoguttaceae bacterium]
MQASGWNWIVSRMDLLLPVTLEMLFDATLILAIAMLINLALHRAAASVRHRVWALAMAGLLILPMLCLVLPKFPIPLDIPITAARLLPSMPESGSETAVPLLSQDGSLPSVAVDAMVPRLDRLPQKRDFALSQQSIATTAGPRLNAQPTADRQLYKVHSIAVWCLRALMLLWLLGMGLGLAAMARVLRAERRMANGDFPLCDPSWQSLFDEIGTRLGVRRAIKIGISSQSVVPLTIGWLKPKILLPADCIHWPAAKRRAVLIHELSHVARSDVFCQIAARLACIVYWLHPLAWLAARKMQ